MRKLSTLLIIFAFGLLASATPAAQTASTAAPGPAAAKTVGADKCAKICHKIQLESWLKSEHAKEKKAECETCHGAGSGYMTIAVMKDPVKAKAAGLIAKPDKASCVACHKKGVADEALPKVHAHKAKPKA
jgi:hypothetical protein